MSADNTSTETVTTDTHEETSDAVVTNQATTEEDPKPGTTTEPADQQDQTLPDTHPLVKAFAAQKEELKALKQAGQTTQEQAAAELKTAKDELAKLAPVQARYTRLEEFLTAVGGPISKALDSRSFTTALFESDESVTDLVAKWHKDNPSATSAALNSGAGSGKTNAGMNDLLRRAAK